MWKWFKRVFIGEFNHVESTVHDQITDSVTSAKKIDDELNKRLDNFIDQVNTGKIKVKKSKKNAKK